MLFDRFPLLLVVLLSSFTLSASSPGLFDSAWNELLQNRPLQARELFREQINDKDPVLAAEAYRGLGAVETFLGHANISTLCFIDAFRKDKDLLMFSARPDFFLNRNIENDKSIDDLLRKLTSSNGLFTGWYQDALLQKYLNSGESKKAAKLSSKMGLITDWQFIGPFENISNCGFSRRYPPEYERLFDKEYDGKNGNKVCWHKLKNATHAGWVFVNNHDDEDNAVYLFNNQIISPLDQEVYLSFGASGVFQVFVNNNLVLADSIFRNTGIDTYMQKVKLRKGSNDLLIKIGHENIDLNGSSSGYANFIVRFLDKSYKPVTNFKSQLNTAESYIDSTVYQKLNPTPILDSISSVLNAKLMSDSTCFDAFFLLVALYNVYEQTNDAQLIIQKFIKKYPNSSILYSMLAESLYRSKKFTDYEVAMKKAFDLCNLNRAAWNRQLRLSISKGNHRAILDFLNESPVQFKKSVQATIASLTAAIQQKNSSDAMKYITELETYYANNPEAVQILMSYYVSQGALNKASDLLRKNSSQSSAQTCNQLAELEIRQGNIKKGMDNYLKAIEINPTESNAYLQLSKIDFNRKEYADALLHINKCLEIKPYSSVALNLKGNILASMGRKDEAINVFMQTVKHTSDDFTAWESIRMLKNQKSFEQMTPLPDVDSLIKASSEWLKSDKEKAALLSCIEDVYLYPSRCSATRNFIVLHLPNQNEIEKWKEYRIPYNSNYQQLHIERALSHKADGTEINADFQNNYVVFKSLEPGDCIVLEYNLKNYYEGVMADKVYGKWNFRLGVPTLSSKLRFITPGLDSIPYKIIGDSIQVNTSHDEDYNITTISAPAYYSESQESFSPDDYVGYPKVIYSNFQSWGQISDWYYELSSHKQSRTIELEAITDSLLANTKSDWEKALKIHDFITRNINYSFVPFRQSGWVPQAAKDVLTTRIGDCKDMASLAKSMMDIAGIKSWLVLVNTGLRYFSDHAYIGPNFDHCILQFFISDKSYFVDLTDRNSALGNLPASDQGAMALVIKPGNDKIIELPTDSPEMRKIKRTIRMNLDSSGTLQQYMETERCGIFASQLRSIYRFKSESERKGDLHRAVSSEYPDVRVDSVWFDNFDQMSDTMRFGYKMTAKNAADVNGSTVIYSVKIPDILSAGYYPVEPERKNPVDMSSSFASIIKLATNIELTIPENWKLINKLQNVNVETNNMSYSLVIDSENEKITIKRDLTCNFKRIFTKDEFAGEQSALLKVTKADDLKLIFNVE